MIHLLGVLLLVLSAPGSATARDDEAEIEQLASRWVEAVAARDPAFFDLLSQEGRAYYPKVRDLALRADAERLRKLPMVDQLQAMFLRLMLESAELEAMGERELLHFALERGLVGMDLRASDELREIVVASDRAQGRLYKFGLDARPDRGLQHFVREEGAWRVELRGELERLGADFQAFADRGRLSPSEAAFFVLEMRLMRKVTPADFDPPLAGRPAPSPAAPFPQERPRPRLRLIAVRTPLDASAPVAVTLEDRVESLRYVLVVGDALPSHPEYELVRTASDAAVLRAKDDEITLQLDPRDALLTPRLRPTGRSPHGLEESLLEQAQQGAEREGLMAQWRNVGLRDRPLLLQQGWLTPVYPPADGPSERMAGLRVQKLVPGSFWHQLGMQRGDLLTAVNERPIDSMEAWQGLIEVAQNDLAITITVERAAKRLRFRTRTIRPR